MSKNPSPYLPSKTYKKTVSIDNKSRVKTSSAARKTKKYKQKQKQKIENQKLNQWLLSFMWHLLGAITYFLLIYIIIYGI